MYKNLNLLKKILINLQLIKKYMLKITKVKSGKKGPDTIENGSNKKNKPKKYFFNIFIFNYF